MSRPMIQAVAFDLDGLMFDTEALFFKVASEMLSKRGKVFTHEMMSAMIGRRAVLAYPAFKRIAELTESPEELQAEARGLFLSRLIRPCIPRPDFLFCFRPWNGSRSPRRCVPLRAESMLNDC